MYKKFMALILAGMITLQGSFITMGEELSPVDENISSDETSAGLSEDLTEQTFLFEDEILLEEADEPTGSNTLQEETHLSENVEEASSSYNPEDTGQIEESVTAQDMIPEEEDRLTSFDEDELQPSNPKIQAANDFMRAAQTIVAGMSSFDDEPEMTGYSQLTKDNVANTLREYIQNNGKADEEGDYYITSSATVDGVQITANIYDVSKYSSFFFEILYSDTIEDVAYISTVWMSVGYGAKTSADISYFLDLAATEEVYVAASAEIPVPSKYKGTDNIEFNVESLDQDLMDYEIQDLANTSLKAGFSIWNSALLDKVKVSMQTLGFDAYRMTHTHSYKEVVLTPASSDKEGHYRVICTTCGNIKSDKTLPKIASFSLNVTKFIYNGTVQKPNVVVRDQDGNVINSSYIDVTYSDENSKAIGTYSVTVQMKGRYSGSKTLEYSIAKATSETPPQPKLIAAYNSVKGIGVQFYKVDEAKQYVIFRKYKGIWKSIRTIGATDPAIQVTGNKLFYIDTSVKNSYGEGYIYSVASKIGAEVSSFDAKGVAIYRLNAPELKSVKKDSSGNVVAIWEKVSAQGYELQYRDASSSSSKWVKCPQISNTTQTISGLKAGTRYCFRVRCSKTNSARGTYYSHYSNYIYLTV